jgi:sugar lactone lactonase YvrE
MKRAAVLLVAATLACTTATPPPPAAPPAAVSPSAAPVVDEQTRGTITQLEQAIAQQPENMPWIYILATYYDKAHQYDKVVTSLQRLDELGWTLGVRTQEFRNTKTREFRDMVSRLDQREPRVNNASTAFVLKGQRSLIPEGITFDPVDDVFYVSSIYQRKVVRVDRNGRVSDFTTEGQDGMLAGLGLHVDAARRLLWVATTASEEMRGYTPELQGRSILYAFDLRNGRVVKRVEQGDKEKPSFLNDLAILADGSVLVTDTTRHNVVRLAEGSDSFEVFVDGLAFPNGITTGDDPGFVWIADFRGITRVTLADKTRQKIETKELLNGIDGLSFHRGSLIGIQNAIGKARVVRIGADGADSGRVELLESKNEAFEVPTTGVVVGDEYFFIANPGLRSFDENHKLWPVEKLEEPIMMRIKTAAQ